MEEKQNVDRSEILGKDRYVWSQKPKAIRITPMAILSKKTEREWITLKSFELFFDDAVITEIVSWINQKIENVKASYTSKAGFLYNTSVPEIRALIGILLFLGATNSSKESTASIWAKDGTGKPICITAISQKLFLFLVYCLGFDDSTTRVQRRPDDKVAPIRIIYDKFVVACEANYNPGTGCTVDESLH